MSMKAAAGFLTSRLFSVCLYNSYVSFLFCAKVCEPEKLETF